MEQEARRSGGRWGGGLGKRLQNSESGGGRNSVKVGSPELWWWGRQGGRGYQGERWETSCSSGPSPKSGSELEPYSCTSSCTPSHGILKSKAMGFPPHVKCGSRGDLILYSGKYVYPKVRFYDFRSVHKVLVAANSGIVTAFSF